MSTWSLKKKREIIRLCGTWSVVLFASDSGSLWRRSQVLIHHRAGLKAKPQTALHSQHCFLTYCCWSRVCSKWCIDKHFGFCSGGTAGSVKYSWQLSGKKRLCGTSHLCEPWLQLWNSKKEQLTATMKSFALPWGGHHCHLFHKWKANKLQESFQFKPCGTHQASFYSMQVQPVPTAPKRTDHKSNWANPSAACVKTLETKSG